MIRSLLMTGRKKRIEYIGEVTQEIYGGGLSVDISSIDILAGDLILVTNAFGYHTSGAHYASGFTTIDTIYGSSSDRNINMTIGYKIADGSETSISYNSAVVDLVIVRVYRNVDTTNPIDVHLKANGGGSSPNPPSVTPNYRNSMIVAVGAIYNSISTASGYFTSPDLEDFTSFSQKDTLYDAAIAQGNHKLLSGTFDPQPFTYVGSISNTCWVAGTIALKCK
ncbi:hypothetical protein [Sulfurimonas sp.]|uniref:hypothetical protein n=1 Tax=Sulfurimonas sp. TaxID=2022749 RepID=UPI00260BD43E|nr:hypothetical protein [Sulfurimonas sp.]MDD3452554.1 hypothetical protein [Sulfurimonas sp.]